MKRLIRGWPLGVFVVCQLWRPSVAMAHGETSQSSWTRTSAATFFDVKLSKDAVAVGEHLTLTGKLKVLESWPYVLGRSDMAYLALNIPGPTLTVKERWINGAFVPGSFEVKPGDFFEFRLELAGRRPGEWHVHPRVDFKGKGPVVGPGFYTRVHATSAGYSRPVSLLNGKTVDLERVGLSTVVSWHAIWILIAAVWVAWWLRGSLYRRFVRVRRGEADDQLVGPRDRRLAAVLGLVTISLLIGGYKYSNAHYQTLPLQVHREPVPAGEEPPPLAAARMQGAEFDGSAGTLRVALEVSNASQAPVTVDQFTTSVLTFARRSGEPVMDRALTVEPDDPIAPGTKRAVSLVMESPDWKGLKLIPHENPLMKMGGLVFFRGPDGARSWVSVFGDVVSDSLKKAAGREARRR